VDARLTGVSLAVRNQDKAVEYYTTKVGFEKKTDYYVSSGYRYVTVGPKGQDLELALWQLGTPDPRGFSHEWRPGASPPITLHVDDCQRTFEEMKSRGVEFKQSKPEEYFWGISAMFTDPDGNTFWIAQHTAKAPSW
jgi:catechol 2,3-dioxygenase-like lactoylglutathione lyase family enzyme